MYECGSRRPERNCMAPFSLSWQFWEIRMRFWNELIGFGWKLKQPPFSTASILASLQLTNSDEVLNLVLGSLDKIIGDFIFLVGELLKPFQGSSFMAVATCGTAVVVQFYQSQCGSPEVIFTLMLGATHERNRADNDTLINGGGGLTGWWVVRLLGWINRVLIGAPASYLSIPP